MMAPRVPSGLKLQKLYVANLLHPEGQSHAKNHESGFGAEHLP